MGTAFRSGRGRRWHAIPGGNDLRDFGNSLLRPRGCRSAFARLRRHLIGLAHGRDISTRLYRLLGIAALQFLFERFPEIRDAKAIALWVKPVLFYAPA